MQRPMLASAVKGEKLLRLGCQNLAFASSSLRHMFSATAPESDGYKRSSTASSDFPAQEAGFKIDMKAVQGQQSTNSSSGSSMSGSEKATWWHPDPVSGVWVPEDKFGTVDSVQLRDQRLRNWPRASLDERVWWSSLEELPDENNRPTKSNR